MGRGLRWGRNGADAPLGCAANADVHCRRAREQEKRLSREILEPQGRAPKKHLRTRFSTTRPWHIRADSESASLAAKNAKEPRPPRSAPHARHFRRALAKRSVIRKRHAKCHAWSGQLPARNQPSPARNVHSSLLIRFSGPKAKSNADTPGGASVGGDQCG